MAKVMPVHHRCPPVCHFCPDMAEIDESAPLMPWCYGGAVIGFEACHCAAGEFDLAELVRRRDFLRRELQDIERRIVAGMAAANKVLAVLPRQKGA